MMSDDFFEEGEQLPDEPAMWQPPVACPQCSQMRTRLVTLRDEMSIYACELRKIEFEIRGRAVLNTRLPWTAPP